MLKTKKNRTTKRLKNEFVPNGGLDQVVGLEVDGGCGFVKHQHLVLK